MSFPCELGLNLNPITSDSEIFFVLQSLEKSSGKADLLARMSKMGQAILTSPQTSVEEHETKEIVDEENKQQQPQQPQQQQQQQQQYQFV